MSKAKRLVSLGVFGFLGGIGIGHLFSIIIAAIVVEGAKFIPVVSSFLEMMGGNEIVATLLAALVYGIIGLSFSLASEIWPKEEWSLLKRSAIYYFVTIIPMFLGGVFLRWFPLKILAILLFILIFSVIYAVIWVTTYLIMRKEIKAINDKLSEKK